MIEENLDNSKTAFTETPPKITRSLKGVRWDRRILYVLLLVILLGSAFYWYEIRPAKIRHDCSWRKGIIWATPNQPTRDRWDKTSEDQYKFCLRDHGL